LLNVLTEIRDNQQERAESLQEKGHAMMGIARKAMAIILPGIIVLVIYLSWLIFR